MTEEKILEGNKLIAEFMGAEFINDAPKDYPNGYYMWNGSFESDYSQLEDFEFHLSWNWIMPCFGKLRLMRFKYEISDKICSIKSFSSKYDTTSIYETTLESCYNSMVKFVKWYNNEKL